MKVFMKKCGFSFFLSIIFLLFAGRYVHVNDLYDKLDIHSGVVAGCLMLFAWLFCEVARSCSTLRDPMDAAHLPLEKSVCRSGSNS